MKRMKVKGTGYRKPSEPDDDPDFYSSDASAHLTNEAKMSNRANPEVAALANTTSEEGKSRLDLPLLASGVVSRIPRSLQVASPSTLVAAAALTGNSLTSAYSSAPTFDAFKAASLLSNPLSTTAVSSNTSAVWQALQLQKQRQQLLLLEAARMQQQQEHMMVLSNLLRQQELNRAAMAVALGHPSLVASASAQRRVTDGGGDMADTSSSLGGGSAAKGGRSGKL